MRRLLHWAKGIWVSGRARRPSKVPRRVAPTTLRYASRPADPPIVIDGEFQPYPVTPSDSSTSSSPRALPKPSAWPRLKRSAHVYVMSKRGRSRV